jgi:hypothetical protein
MRSRDKRLPRPRVTATSQNPPDSHLDGSMIQGCFWGGSLGCDGPFGFERRGVGADGAADHRIGRPDQKGSTGRDNRMFVEGVLWIVRTGSPWRDSGGVRRLE